MAGFNYVPPRLYDITVPDLFTLIAQEYPQRDIVQIVREHADAPTDSLRISWPAFLQDAQNTAADLRARWAAHLTDEAARIRAAHPRTPGSRPVVVSMLGANGYEYYVHLIACTLNRWTALPISPKNSVEAIEHLLRTSESTVFLVDANFSELGHTLEQSISGMSTLSFARLESLAHVCAPPLVPLTPRELETENDMPAFYMHTSGSTGEFLIWIEDAGTVVCDDGSGVVDRLGRVGKSPILIARSIQGTPNSSPGHIGFSLEVFDVVTETVLWASADPSTLSRRSFTGMFMAAHGNLLTFVSSPTPKPPSAAAILTLIPFIPGGIVALPPSILEELCDLGPEAVKTVSEGTSMVIFAGAPLKKETGRALIAAGLKVTAAFGATELGPASIIYPQAPENWEYIEFREGYNMTFLPVDGHSELRELVVVPGEDCPAVLNHENPRGYATNDIWEPHPTIPKLWKHHSRKGNVTVLSNGEKTDNKQIESLLLEDKRILYVQVFGAGRPLNGVLLQPANPSLSPTQFISQIQPTIDRVNTILPRHSRLVPELIVVVSQNKPFATTEKGTVKSQETLERYASEIERGYAVLEDGTEDAEWVFDGCVTSARDIGEFLQRAVKGVLGVDVPDTADLFEYGLDSLLAIRLRAILLSVIKKTPTASQPVRRNIMYAYPTIDALTGFLLSRASSQAPTLNGDNATHERIRRSIARFSAEFVAHEPGIMRMEGSVVALTGSTGSLGEWFRLFEIQTRHERPNGSKGSSLLASLLEREDIVKIYLLNRPGSTTAQERQVAGFKARGLDIDLLERKKRFLTYLEIDLSRKDLGLTHVDYEELRLTVTHIIHAAWNLNFNLILESYERVHVAGVRHLIDLALSSPQAQSPRLVFLSSIAASGRYRGPSQAVTQGDSAGQVLVPEQPIDDPSIPLDQGYAESKYVSERVVVAAVQQAGLRATVVRVGQLSGVTTNGAWSVNEHVPIMFRSSVALGIIPNDLPPVRWVPSDIAASAILKQTFDGSSELEYFHIENPVLTPWAHIVQAVSDASPRPLRPVSLAAWLQNVAAQSAADPEMVPAVRLLQFFQGMAESGESVAALGWQRSLKFAPELFVGPATGHLVQKYVLYQLQSMKPT